MTNSENDISKTINFLTIKLKTIKMKRIFYRSAKMLVLIAGIGILIASCKKDDIPVTGITLDKRTAIVQVGATLNLLTFLTPGDASNKGIKWKSASQSVATVANGVVTGVALGNTTITAVSQADTTFQATCTVTIIPSTGMTIVPVSGEIIASTTWTANKIYTLSGFVYVRSPAVLTI
jgi:uncharacterized protein YjdB